MVLHILKRQGILHKKSTQLAIVSMMLGTGFAAADTIWSVYLDSFVSSDSIVGLITGMLTIVSILFYFFSTPLIERYPETKIWLYSAIFGMIGYAAFYFTRSLGAFIIIATLIVLTNVLRVQAFGILVRDVTKLSEIGKVEGLLYAIDNIGWVVGPLIAGFLAARYGFREVFLLTAIFMLIGIASFLMTRIRDIDHHTKDDGTIKSALKNAKEFFTTERGLKTYFISGGVSFHWAIVYIYIPLFILDAGLSPLWIGLFLFMTSVPLMILEYPIGNLADRMGFKPFFITGFALIAIISFLAFLSGNIIGTLLLFVLASVGAACLESTTESYFFRVFKQSEEEKFYGPYVTCDDVMSAASKLLGALVLFLLPQQYLFLMLSVVMLALVGLSMTIKEKRKQAHAVANA